MNDAGDEPMNPTPDSKNTTPEQKAPDGLHIRPLKIDDLADVFHLGEKIFTLKTYPNLYRIWDEHEVIEYFTNDADACFVAEIDGNIGGFVLGYTIEKRNTARKYGYLVWLGVDAKYKGCGIASRLFSDFKEYMVESGVKMLLVDTEASNVPALEFFKGKGFTTPMDHVYLSLKLIDDM